MSDAEATQPRRFLFLRNGDAAPTLLDWQKQAETARQAIAEAMNAKNVAFLLGAGCSSLIEEGVEVGIPTMAPLAKEFCGSALQTLTQPGPSPADSTGETAAIDDPQGEAADRDCGDRCSAVAADPPGWLLNTEELTYLADLGIDLEDGYNRNLERLMEVLYRHRFVLKRSTKSSHWKPIEIVTSIIDKMQAFLWDRCTQGRFAKDSTAVRDLYEKFYRKLVLRDRSLPRPWVFTTNYDLFNETAMDRLGIPYANGFSGVVERRFNPSSFRYALAEQLDVGGRKWSAVDAFVYLCKLHGSISWTEDDHGLFPIREQWPAGVSSKVMIFPTPTKQNDSLASPYADLFREFQSRIVREQSVLITVGYAFGDEHVNNIIYQALTIPTFRLIIFARPDVGGEIGKLRALRDPRIWIIGGDGPTEESRAHYFDTVVEHLMPQRPSERIDDAVRKVLQEMIPTKAEDA
jgi:hypothetical protein